MDQTNDQQATSQPLTTTQEPVVQNSPNPTTAQVQPSAQTTDPQSSQPSKEVVHDENSIDLSAQKDINPEDLRNKLNETLAQPLSAPVVELQPVEPAVSEQPSQQPSAVQVDKPKETQPIIDPSVIVYTIDNCQFCKAEKEYLTAHSIPFEEKRVDDNEANLKEMLALSDNFAGVPVTHLKGASSQRVVKGFTEAEFVQELTDAGLLTVEPAQSTEAVIEKPIEAQADLAPATPQQDQAPVQEPAPMSQQPSENQAPTQQTEAQQQHPTMPTAPLEQPSANVAPTADQAPSIPDFPQK